MAGVKQGSWVRIRRTILEAAKRTARIPDETKKVPFVMWDKGYLTADANIGDEVTVKTRTGRLETGELVEVDPQYELGYGDFIPELLQVGDQAREILFGGEDK